MNHMRALIISWLPSAALATLMCLLVYAALQQDYRQSLNDPQIQMAEDAAASLSSDYTPAAALPRSEPPVDIAQSLRPWVAVYDASGTPLESSAVLDGAPPRLPAGVFDTNRWNGFIIGHHFNAAPPDENRFTWQPREGVRQAVVLVAFSTPHGAGFVAAGRNMREGEARISRLGVIVLAMWLASLAAALAAHALKLFTTR